MGNAVIRGSRPARSANLKLRRSTCAADCVMDMYPGEAVLERSPRYRASPFIRKEGDVKTQHHHVITKILVSAAIALGFFVGGAAPASADTNAIGTDQNPFSGLTCNCRETAPAGSPALTDEINRGIREGRSAWLPGLPAPTGQQPR